MNKCTYVLYNSGFYTGFFAGGGGDDRTAVSELESGSLYTFSFISHIEILGGGGGGGGVSQGGYPRVPPSV